MPLTSGNTVTADLSQLPVPSPAQSRFTHLLSLVARSVGERPQNPKRPGYADQNEREHAALERAIRDERVKAVAERTK